MQDARPTLQMTSPSRRRPPCALRFAAGACLLAGSAALAQAQGGSTLPATPRTNQSVPAALSGTLVAGPLNASASPGTTDSRPHRAHVTYSGGLLDVHADNSSLNDILYEIGRATGMLISGGVRDQRVFGNYGPAAPSDVLATLLDGTGTNMLLKESAENDGPVELVLTPRTGGISPPSPSAPNYSNEIDDNGQQTVPGARSTASPQALGRGGLPQSPPPAESQPAQPPPAQATEPASGLPLMPQPLNNPLGNPDNTTPTASQIPTTNSVSTDTLPVPSTAQEPAQGIVDTPNPPPPGSTTSTSPNGVSTPDQIYQQLLKLQQQQNGSTSGAPTTTTPPQPPQ
jgi:hypothetical protein